MLNTKIYDESWNRTHKEENAYEIQDTVQTKHFAIKFDQRETNLTQVKQNMLNIKL